MAGDWIKIEIATSQKIEVFQIAEILELDIDTVLGKLMRLWCWADVNTIDGHAKSVTKKLLDRVVDCDGFAMALLDERVGWLTEDKKGELFFSNFDRHNGKGAKKRATDAGRQAAKRAKDAEKKMSHSQRDKTVTREEKRREDLKDNPPTREDDINSGGDDPHLCPQHVQTINPPSGKFAMHENWQPSPDFFMRSAQWGIVLNPQQYRHEYLTEFIDYWIAESKFYNHVQWEQKFARQLERKKNDANRQKGSQKLDWNNTDWIHGIKEIGT